MTESCLSTSYLLTGNRRLEKMLSDTLRANNLSLPDPEDGISSINNIKENTLNSGNLSWIKKELLSIIQTKGYPFLLIMDIRLDSGNESDRDEIKVLRTLVLSYILISRIESYQDITCNLFVLASHADYQKFRNEVRDPRLLLNHIRTNEPKINDIIQQLKDNPDKFNRLFNIFIANTDSDEASIKSELNVFINMLKAKEKLKIKLKPNQVQASGLPSNASAAPADIVFRFNDTYYVNGETAAGYDTDIVINNGEIYIIGNFTSFTRLQVVEKLLFLITKWPSKEFSFKKNGEVILNIPASSIIDTTIPVTIAQLLSKELADYKNLKIKTSMNNVKKLQQSKGYAMIQKNVVITED